MITWFYFNRVMVYFVGCKMIETSLHQIFLNEPTTEMGPVLATVIMEHATGGIVQPHLIASFQSQRGTQGNGIQISSSSLVSPCFTNIGAVYSKNNVQRSGSFIFNGWKLEMVNSLNWNSESPRGQIESTALVQSRQFKRNVCTGIRIKTGIPLDVEMDALRLDVHRANELLGN